MPTPFVLGLIIGKTNPLLSSSGKENTQDSDKYSMKCWTFTLTLTMHALWIMMMYQQTKPGRERITSSANHYG